MATENTMPQDGTGTASAEPKAPRERSTIDFPYGDLDDAVAVARGVHAIGGSGDWDQLAGQLNQAANGGGFRQKMLTAKLFGVVTYAQGKVSLTSLGTRICDPTQERAARAEAFLAVPLYRAIFDQYRGGTLPPTSGLEAQMVALGVSSKQKDKARQYFQRSATQADFFWSGQDRLVMPAVGNAVGSVVNPPEEKPPRPKENGAGGGGGGGDDPAIQGLIKRLPPADSNWPLEKQAKWLLAISHAFDVIYPREDDARSLKIEIVKD